MHSSLPYSPKLDIAALSRLFANTTNSYKYVFFISYLDILRRRDFSAREPISFREMTVEMLATSWYPHNYFRLSFGLQDKITAKLDSLTLTVGKPVLNFRDIDKKLLREAFSRQKLDNSLMHYVPFRVLRPFFEDELRGQPDYRIDPTIARLATEKYNERKPLYRFNASQDQLIPHPAWAAYLKTHFSVIKGWTAWNWLQYMQKCNQAVPAISSKLFPPQNRDSLKVQAEYWKTAIRHGGLKCIYSGEPLSPEKVSLDHFLPWSFVAHDQLWNLIPTQSEVNSSKSDNLPASSYFDGFVRLQHQGLVITNKQVEEQKWNKYIEPFIADLKVSNKHDLLDQQKLRRAYEATLLPMLTLAQTLGFSSNWHFRHAPSNLK
ncbi:MAG: hypothetical protein M3X11_19070 [Acidobacteriota bacterium]|nr:hypothetical protein [Acidobacteriota bacterium]